MGTLLYVYVVYFSLMPYCFLFGAISSAWLIFAQTIITDVAVGGWAGWISSFIETL